MCKAHVWTWSFQATASESDGSAPASAVGSTPGAGRHACKRNQATKLKELCNRLVTMVFDGHHSFKTNASESLCQRQFILLAMLLMLSNVLTSEEQQAVTNEHCDGLLAAGNMATRMV